jgi:hypothetical protein
MRFPQASWPIWLTFGPVRVSKRCWQRRVRSPKLSLLYVPARDVELTVRQHHSFDLDPADLEILRAIKSAIPDASDRQPGEVFNVVLEAIKASNAKLIVCETVSADDKS